MKKLLPPFWLILIVLGVIFTWVLSGYCTKTTDLQRKLFLITILSVSAMWLITYMLAHGGVWYDNWRKK